MPPPSADDQFHTHLRELVATLRVRAKSELKNAELEARFKDALIILDAAQALAPLRRLVYDKFRERFCVPAIVHPVRQRDWGAAVGAFKRLAEEGIAERARREAAGEKMDDLLPAASDLAACLALLTPDMCSRVMPLKNLDALFKYGAALDTSHPVRPLIVGFNDKYAEFLENMCVAFSPQADQAEAEHAAGLPDKLQRALMYNPSLVFDRYVEAVRPHVRVLRDPSYSEHLYGSPDVFFACLPYMESLPLAALWADVMSVETNARYVHDSFQQLLFCTLGLPATLVSRDFIEGIRSSVEAVLANRSDLTDAACGPDGQPDASRSLAVAMHVMKEMTATGAIQQLIDATGSITADINTDMVKAVTDEVVPESMRDDVATGLEIAEIGGLGGQ